MNFNTNIIMYEIRELIRQEIDYSFTLQKDPVTGQNWPPLKPATIKRKKPRMRTQILQNTRVMRRGVNLQILGNTIEVSNAERYAPFHQLGTRKMPQRRFLPFKDNGEASDSLISKIDTYLAPDNRGGQEVISQVIRMLFN
ncbi:phage virion morphogenesis protein [Helicobacter suis]|uniref:phage virion morphogenesis protein n=1 Tax=Helicobacter suis TaxID=104628 RepID=UPI0013CF8CF6|nr:phage virion morphogenesis protein [Helicobacter suis]